MRTRVCVHGCYGEGELPRKVISREEKGGREEMEGGGEERGGIRERERENKKGRGKGGDEASVVKSTIAASVKNSN